MNNKFLANKFLSILIQNDMTIQVSQKLEHFVLSRQKKRRVQR